VVRCRDNALIARWQQRDAGQASGQSGEATRSPPVLCQIFTEFRGEKLHALRA
jgi:hypothetical protein